MAISTLATGNIILSMEKPQKSTPLQCKLIRDTFNLVKNTEKENSYIVQATSFKAIGKTTLKTETASSFSITVTSSKANGPTTYPKDDAASTTKAVTISLENTKTA